MSGEDLEQRVTHVEARLDQVARELGRAREDSGDARTLGRALDEHGRVLDEHGRVLGALVAETANNSTRLDQLEAGQQQIVELLAQVLHRLPEPSVATD